MLELSIALVIIAGMASYLVNKYISIKFQINTTPDLSGTIDALSEQVAKFDSRINKSFENHQFIKTELESLKLSIGLKRGN